MLYDLDDDCISGVFLSVKASKELVVFGLNTHLSGMGVQRLQLQQYGAGACRHPSLQLDKLVHVDHIFCGCFSSTRHVAGCDQLC